MRWVALVLTLCVVLTCLVVVAARDDVLKCGAGSGVSWIARLALAIGANPNHNRYGHTPLHAAIDAGDAEMIALLTTHGADVNWFAPGLFAERPLERAISQRRADIALFLLTHGATLPQGSKAFGLAAREGMLPVLEKIADQLRASDTARLQYELDAALFAAIEFAYFDKERQLGVVDWLVRQGARIDQQRSGHTPLTFAIEHQVEEIAIRLFEAGSATLRVETEATATPTPRTTPQPLLMSVSGKLARLTERMLASGASVNIVDGTGRTPLHRAVDIGNATLTRRLLELGALVNVVDHGSRTPLDWAGRNATITALLLAAGGKSGNPPKVTSSGNGTVGRLIQPCRTCRGTGTCQHCNGKRVFAKATFGLGGVSATSRNCDWCNGSGKCSHCRGKGKH